MSLSTSEYTPGVAVSLDSTTGFTAVVPGRLSCGTVELTQPPLAVGSTVWLPRGMGEPALSSRMSGRAMGQSTRRRMPSYNLPPTHHHSLLIKEPESTRNLPRSPRTIPPIYPRLPAMSSQSARPSTVGTATSSPLADLAFFTSGGCRYSAGRTSGNAPAAAMPPSGQRSRHTSRAWKSQSQLVEAVQGSDLKVAQVAHWYAMQQRGGLRYSARAQMSQLYL